MDQNNEAEEIRSESQYCESCPISSIMSMCSHLFNRDSEVYKHITKSRLELLKAFRSMVDKRIEELEQRLSKEQPRKATTISVE